MKANSLVALFLATYLSATIEINANIDEIIDFTEKSFDEREANVPHFIMFGSSDKTR